MIWIPFNHDQIKPLGFDSRSNTSSWRLFFKSSVSYPHFCPQNSFSTYQQMNCSLRILKMLHLVRIRSSGVALQWCNASRIGASSDRSRDHRQLCVNHLIPKYQKYSTGWLNATTIKWYRQVPLLSFWAPLLRLHQTVQEHLKNAYLVAKLLSRVTDSCRKTTSSLVRKYT